MRNRGNMKNLKHFNTSKSIYSNTKNYSSFWMDNDFDRHTSIFDEEDVKPKTDLIALSSYRRAIANFVRIVTEKDIPVTFKSSGDSYTDGKKVVISAKMDDKSFDPSVGLALHEGSHIVHSDFDWLKGLEHSIRQELFHIGETKGYSKHDVIGTIKGLLNYVEDRRIDNIIFTTSPGYKGYYHSMYDKYFHSKIIDKALGTDEYTDETMESYMFRIINLTNKNTNLSSLNGLREIWNTIDLKNISRLKNTEDAFGIAQDILDVIFKNLPDAEVKIDEDGEESYEPAQDSGQGSDSSSNGGGSSDEPMSDEDFQDLLDGIESGEMKSQPKPQPKEEVTETPTDKNLLSDSQKKQLENAIKKQNDFVDGKTTKKNVTKKELNDLQTIESSGMSYVEVGDGLKTWDGKKQNTKCIVVREFSKKLVESGTISMVSKWKGDRYDENVKDGYETDYISEGIRLGTVLGRKLQVRGESRETKWTRLDSGRIDKRLVAELGFGNDRVFSNSFVEEYSDAFLHISIDASGSMGGSKWTNTMKSVVAMTKAIDMINNVDVVVSFRTTQTSGGRTRRGDTTKPLILIAYDSRKDSFIKVKTLFKYLTVAGTTPEGLCYEAIMNDIVPSTNDKDSYFLNFSDGMPMFGNGDVDYHGDVALNHTKKMVKEIRNRGIKVLSYFVSDSNWNRDSESRSFKTMYGKDAEYIDITSVMSVSKTMNKKFLQK